MIKKLTKKAATPVRDIRRMIPKPSSAHPLKKTRSLRVMRSRFSAMVPRLINHAIICGYEVTINEVFRHPKASHGHADSLHKSGLAIDINLFLDGKYLRKTGDHEFLGEYWESIGGAWGGRWGDGNHYSLAWRGMR